MCEECQQQKKRVGKSIRKIISKNGLFHDVYESNVVAKIKMLEKKLDASFLQDESSDLRNDWMMIKIAQIESIKTNAIMTHEKKNA